MSSMVIDVEQVDSSLGRPGPSRDAAGGSRRAEGRGRPARPRPSTATGDPPLRLTRRGRLVVVLVVLALAYAGLTMVSAPAASTGEVRHVRAQTVVVTPGETLWDIARSVAPESDPRDVVAEIVDLNSLTDPGAIRVGQPLDVPAQ
jgi:nucleoid-associated protein YgaU